jgi:hypothetical protein
MPIVQKTNGKSAETMPSYEQLAEMVKQQQAAMQAMQAQLTSKNTLKLKISEKGALSIYGLGRFPVTLYSGQWERLLNMADEIREFMRANAASLSTK